MHLPVMDGFALLDELAAVAGPCRDFKSIIIAAQADVDTALKAIDRQVAAFILKPINTRELVRRTNRAIADFGAAPRPDQLMPSTDDLAEDISKKVVADLERYLRRTVKNTALSQQTAGAADSEGASPRRVGGAAPDTGRFTSYLSLERKLRAKFFPEHFFGDPCREMLIDLAESKAQGKQVYISSLCIASGVPQTTALRRIEDLEKAGLISRSKDPADGRRIIVDLTARGTERIKSYFGEIRTALSNRNGCETIDGTLPEGGCSRAG